MLRDTCIDAAAVSVAKYKKHSYYVHCISSYILLQNIVKSYYLKFQPLKELLKDVTFIALPYNADNIHWAFIIINLETKIVYFFDPSSKSAIGGNEVLLKCFKKIVARRNRYNLCEKLNSRAFRLAMEEEEEDSLAPQIVGCLLFFISGIYAIVKL